MNKSKNLRVIGGGYNFNGWCFGETTIRLGINFSNYKLNNNTVVLGGGCYLYKIHKWLRENGYQLSSVGICLNTDSSQTIGGVCATNVHHTGKSLKPFSETCIWIKVAHYNTKGKAVIKKYSLCDKFFRNYFGSIGSLGILLSAKFKIKPVKNYKIIIYKNIDIKSQDITNKLKNNGFLFHNNRQLSTYKITKEDPENPEDNELITPLKHTMVDEILTNTPIPLLNTVTPYINVYNNKNNFNVKGLYNIGFSTGIITREFEVFTDCKNFKNVREYIENYNVQNECFITSRYISKLNNSNLTLHDKNLTATDFSYFGKSTDKIDERFRHFSSYLKEQKIKHYFHSGKFISPGYKMKDFFEKSVVHEFKTIKRKVDSENIFKTCYV
jgi:hypothetical protein